MNIPSKLPLLALVLTAICTARAQDIHPPTGLSLSPAAKPEAAGPAAAAPGRLRCWQRGTMVVNEALDTDVSLPASTSAAKAGATGGGRLVVFSVGDALCLAQHG